MGSSQGAFAKLALKKEIFCEILGSLCSDTLVLGKLTRILGSCIPVLGSLLPVFANSLPVLGSPAFVLVFSTLVSSDIPSIHSFDWNRV